MIKHQFRVEVSSGKRCGCGLGGVQEEASVVLIL